MKVLYCTFFNKEEGQKKDRWWYDGEWQLWTKVWNKGGTKRELSNEEVSPFLCSWGLLIERLTMHESMHVHWGSKYLWIHHYKWQFALVYRWDKLLQKSPDKVKVHAYCSCIACTFAYYESNCMGWDVSL